MYYSTAVLPSLLPIKYVSRTEEVVIVMLYHNVVNTDSVQYLLVLRTVQLLPFVWYNITSKLTCQYKFEVQNLLALNLPQIHQRHTVGSVHIFIHIFLSLKQLHTHMYKSLLLEVTLLFLLG